jgi:4-hydroxybenzoate polyprenyltransferase
LVQQQDIDLAQDAPPRSTATNFLELTYRYFLLLLIFPNLWVAAGIASLVLFVEGMLDLQVSWHACLLVFSLALVAYNLDRIIDTYVQSIPDPDTHSFFRKPFPFLIVGLAGLIAGALLVNAPQYVHYVSIAGVIPLLYGVPLFPLYIDERMRWFRVKDIPGSKAWIVASVITYAVIAVPVAYAGANLNQSVWGITLFVFVFLSTNAHLFDVRDIASDKQKGVLTMPIILGLTSTRIVLSLLNLIMLAVLASWNHFFGVTAIPSEIFLPTILFDLCAIWLITVNVPRNIYTIGLDGSLFLPVLLMWMLVG